MGKKIFLSYTLSDKVAVQMFKEELNREDIKFDFLEHAVIEDTEQEWKNHVTEKIKIADIFICLFGFSTWESEAVKWEVELAIANNKKVLVVKLKSTVFMIPKYIIENDIQIFEEDSVELVNQLNS